MKCCLFVTVALSLACAASLHAQDALTNAATCGTITPGTGANPKPGQDVFLHATILDATGKPIFSTREMGVTMHNQIGKETDAEAKAFDAVYQKMQKGGVYRVEMPKKVLNDEFPYKNAVPGETMVFNFELVDVKAARPSGADLIAGIAEKEGAEAAKERFDALQVKNAENYAFYEWDMNMVGYELLGKEKKEEAVAVFEMVTRLYPKSYNAYDSLGDGYLEAGDVEQAKVAFEKALELNPNYASSREKLSKL